MRQEWQVQWGGGTLVLIRSFDATREELASALPTSLAVSAIRHSLLSETGGLSGLSSGRWLVTDIARAVALAGSFIVTRDRASRQLIDLIGDAVSSGRLLVIRRQQPTIAAPIRRGVAIPPPVAAQAASPEKETCWLELDVINDEKEARTGAIVRVLRGKKAIATATVGKSPRVRFDDVPEATDYEIEVEDPDTAPGTSMADSSQSADADDTDSAYC